jgi:hypothetical protein
MFLVYSRIRFILNDTNIVWVMMNAFGMHCCRRKYTCEQPLDNVTPRVCEHFPKQLYMYS